MFSLIITLISIALVAALALASLYYGGPAFNKGAARAHASKILVQGYQLQGAAELYKADKGSYPVSLADLVAEDYLKSIPVALQEQPLLPNALAASSWVMVAPQTPVFALTEVNADTCKAINQMSYGEDGILKSAREDLRTQCYGPNSSSLLAVIGKAPADLVAASNSPVSVVNVGPVLSAPIPGATSGDSSDTGWLVKPGAGDSATAGPAVEFLTGKGASIMALTGTSRLYEKQVMEGVNVKNSKSTPITFSGVSASVPAPFNIETNGCSGQTLQPGESCEIQVGFTPSDAVTYVGALYEMQLSAINETLPALPLEGVGLVHPMPPTTMLFNIALSYDPNFGPVELAPGVMSSDKFMYLTMGIHNDAALSALKSHKANQQLSLYLEGANNLPFSDELKLLSSDMTTINHPINVTSSQFPFLDTAQDLSELIAGKSELTLEFRQPTDPENLVPFSVKLPVGASPGQWCAYVSAARLSVEGRPIEYRGNAVEGTCP